MQNFFGSAAAKAAAAITDRIKAAGRILILCHVRPDGDTLGGGFALAELARALGAEADVSVGGEIGKNLAFLGEAKTPSGRYDLVAAVDCARAEMLGNNAAYADLVDIIIDHHQGGADYGKSDAIRLIEPRAGAVGELIFLCYMQCGAEPSAKAAEAIYTAIATDTGCFVFGNTEAFSHFAASRLMAAGLEPSGLNRKLFETKTKGYLALYKMLLESMILSEDGAIAAACITDDMLARAGAGQDDADGLSGVLRQIEGVEACALVKQNGGDVRVSVRSNSIVDASAVCAAFGGGGHKRAAGCTLKCGAAEARDRVFDELCRAYKSAL